MFRSLVSLCSKSKKLLPSFVNVRNECGICCTETPPTIPACEWSTLANGVRVISEQVLSPLACVKMFVEVGSRYEIPCNNGATHFIEHLAFKGYPGVPRLAFECALEDMGIKMSVHTDREYQVFTAIGPNDSLECIFTCLYNVVCKLAFDPLEVEMAKIACLDQMVQVERDPKAVCFDYLHKTAFQGTTLEQSVIGPSQNYHNFDMTFACQYYEQRYQPFRIVLAASSSKAHHDIVCMAQCNFCGMRETSNKLVYWPCRYTGSAAMFRNDDMPFCHVALAVETGGYGSRDYLKYHLIKHYLGSWDESQVVGHNHHFKLARACALGKLCVRYESFYIPYKDVGLLGIYFVVPREDDIDDMFFNVTNEFMNMCTTLTRNELCNAVPRMILDLAKNTEGCERSCHDMGLQMLHYGCRRNFLDLSEAVSCYSDASIRETCTSIVYDRCPVFAGVGPTESIPEYNRVRSAFHWMRL